MPSSKSCPDFTLWSRAQASWFVQRNWCIGYAMRTCTVQITGFLHSGCVCVRGGERVCVCVAFFRDALEMQMNTCSAQVSRWYRKKRDEHVWKYRPLGIIVCFVHRISSISLDRFLSKAMHNISILTWSNYGQLDICCNNSWKHEARSIMPLPELMFNMTKVNRIQVFAAHFKRLTVLEAATKQHVF